MMTLTPQTNQLTIAFKHSLTKYQHEAMFHPARYVIIAASTKSGKTHSALVWLICKACERRANYWWISPVYSQAKIAYTRMKRGFAKAGGQHIGITSNDTEMTVTLPNGSVIWFKGSDHSDSLYGEDVAAAVIDEASRCKEESWHAVRSTLTATKGDVRIIGNCTGKTGWFWKLGERARSGEPNMHFVKITAYDAVAAGILDAREIEDAKRTLPDNVFKQLYLAEPSDDGSNPFGYDAINSCIAPLSTAPPVCYGVDLAKSVDWTVVVGLDADGTVCRFERWQSDWHTTCERLKSIIGDTPALIDSTGVGDPVLDELKRDCRKADGFKFTSESKQRLMEGLAVAIQSQTVRYVDREIADELRTYEYTYTRTGVRYEAPSGLHDDCVCALALAVQAKANSSKRTPIRFH